MARGNTHLAPSPSAHATFHVNQTMEHPKHCIIATYVQPWPTKRQVATRFCPFVAASNTASQSCFAGSVSRPNARTLVGFHPKRLDKKKGKPKFQRRKHVKAVRFARIEQETTGDWCSASTSKTARTLN